jgi:hypothetical protein
VIRLLALVDQVTARMRHRSCLSVKVVRVAGIAAACLCLPKIVDEFEDMECFE